MGWGGRSNKREHGKTLVEDDGKEGKREEEARRKMVKKEGNVERKRKLKWK